MARSPFTVGQGFRFKKQGVNGQVIDYLFGDGEPGGDGAEQDAAREGSVFYRTDSPYGAFIKKGRDNSITDWRPIIGTDIKDTIVLTAQNIAEKSMKLSSTPADSSSVRFLPKNGLEQNYGEDFLVNGQDLVFGGLGLDGILEEGDTVYIYYNTN